MFTKLMIGAAAVLAAALFAYLGNRMISAYGDARYQSGLADGRLRQMPDILAANDRANRAGLAARDQVIAADGMHDAELARLIPQLLSAQDKATAYASTIAGRALCLGPDRVRDIETDRAALFPATTASPANGIAAGPVSADTDANAGGS